MRFERPDRISFRLVRGPVPHVVETYRLSEEDGATRFVYEGELGTDLWGLGSFWAGRVGPAWEAAVQRSLEEIRSEAERLARRR